MPVQLHHGHHQQQAQQQQQGWHQTQENPTHHTLTNVIPLQDLHDDTNISSHNSSGDDFQHLFSPLKFLTLSRSEADNLRSDLSFLYLHHIYYNQSCLFFE